MALISQKIKNLLNGVSQRPAEFRPASQAAVQENCLSHRIYGLRRRPPTTHVLKLGDLIAADDGSGTFPPLTEAAGFDYSSDNAVFETRTDVYNWAGASVSALTSIPNTAPAPYGIATTLVCSNPPVYDVYFPSRPELNSKALLRQTQAAGGRPYTSTISGLNVPGMTLIAVLRPIGTCAEMFGYIQTGSYPLFAIGANGSDSIGGMCPGDLTGQAGTTGTYVGGGVPISTYLQAGAIFSGSGTVSPLAAMSASPFDIVTIRIDGTTGHVDFTKNGFACPNTFTAPVGPYNFSNFVLADTTGAAWDWARTVFWSKALTSTELTAAVRNLGHAYHITVA